MTYAGNKLLNGNNLVATVLVTVGVILYYKNAGNEFLFFIIPVVLLITAMEAFYFELNDN